MIGQIVGGLVGGLLGGGGGGESSATQQMKMDPRMDRFVYGDSGKGGLLGSAFELAQNQMKTGGLNPLQMGGMEMQRQFLMSPQYQQGYGNMMGLGQNLMGAGVAGNPFTSGQAPKFGGMPNFGYSETAAGPGLLKAISQPWYQQSMEAPQMQLASTESDTAKSKPVDELNPHAKVMFDQFKAAGLSDEQAYQMAMNYNGNGFDGGA
jgi:hypothetical protein